MNVSGSYRYRRSRRQVVRLNDARERDGGALVDVAHRVGVVRLEEAGDLVVAGHVHRADVTHRLALGGGLLARGDGGLLRSCELVHRDTGKVALGSEDGHGAPPWRLTAGQRCTTGNGVSASNA